MHPRRLLGRPRGRSACNQGAGRANSSGSRGTGRDTRHHTLVSSDGTQFVVAAGIGDRCTRFDLDGNAKAQNPDDSKGMYG
jgi:hypothetical protein